jgi:putative ABC transport system permease protein
MTSLLQDLRYGLRQLRKNPQFTALALLIVALGVGANTAIFSVVSAVLLRPLPFPQSERLVQVWHVPPAASFHGMSRFAVSPANYLDWLNQSRGFEQMAIYGGSNFNLTNQSQPETVMGAKVSSAFFSVLRVHPLLGRAFIPEEDQSGRDHVVLISQAFWQSHCGSNPNIVGQKIILDEQGYTVVGVMPAKFFFPAPDTEWQPQVWTPLGWTAQDRATRGNHNYLVIGRLKPEITLQQAQAEMNTISRGLEQQYPADDKGWGAVVVPLRDQLVGEVRPALLVLLGAVAFVLLIACANLANLLLAKTLAKSREIAIRTALGASRIRVLRQVLSETILLALLGGTLGLLLAHIGIISIVSFMSAKLPRAAEIGLDGGVLGFTFAMSIVTGVLAGLAPAWRLAKSNVNDQLKQGSGRTGSDQGGNRTRSALVVAEIALSLTLLISAGLMVRSLWRLRNVDPGFDPHNLLTLTLDLPPVKYAKLTQQLGFVNEVLRRVRGLPGVDSAGAIDALPLSGNGSTQPIAIEGRPLVEMSEQPEVAVRTITPGYIHATRVAMLKGRDLTEADAADKPAAILVSESLAERFWPNEDPIGKHLTMSFFPGTSREVVGVVGDVKQDGLNVAERIATLYVPFAQTPNHRGLSLVVRTGSDRVNLVSAVTDAVHQVDREEPVVDVMTMDEVLSGSVAQPRFNMLLLAAFAGLALFLAAVGIYGVLSYAVKRRLQEIGIRMALGAAREDVLRMILGQGLRLAFMGVCIGLVASLGVTRFITSQLFEVKASDPLTLTGVSLLLVTVALAACYLPARRATKVEPTVALRYE